MPRTKINVWGAALGIAVRRIRLKRGWSQLQLAERMQTTIHAVSHVETGRCSPKLRTMFDYAEALNVSLSFIAQCIESVLSQPGMKVDLVDGRGPERIDRLKRSEEEVEEVMAPRY